MPKGTSRGAKDGVRATARSGGLTEKLSEGGVFTVAGLGDSLTYGWMVERGFFDRFADRLQSAFPLASIQRINAGIPGDTAAGGLLRVDELLAQSPAAVTVQFGLNDMSQGAAPEDFEASLTAIVRRIRDADAMPIVVTSSPLPWPEGARATMLFYGICRETAEKEAVPIASLDRFWQDRFPAPSEWEALLQSDRVHPTDTGHALMAEGLFSALFPSHGTVSAPD